LFAVVFVADYGGCSYLFSVTLFTSIFNVFGTDV